MLKPIILILIAFASAFAMYAVTYAETKVVIVPVRPVVPIERPLRGSTQLQPAQPLQSNVETNGNLQGINL
jgi:hypothetical protein